MTTPLETAARRRRELASAVKRLRVAATSDPALADELADSLVALNGSRLLAWAFADAAADAPETVLLAARILAGRGPAGPYASLTDAVRYFTASTQLAAVQAGLGQPEASGRTLDALDAWRGQLGRLPLVENLDATVVVWALIARSRSRLSADVAGANSLADAAALRLYAAGLDQDPSRAYLAMAVHLLVADCRWAAGRAEAALAHHRLALARHRTAIAGLPGAKRPKPALAQVAVAPLPELFEPFAQRLEATGDVAGEIATRRAWLTLVAQLAEPATGADQLVRTGLGRALTRAGRADEAAEWLAAAGSAVPGDAPPTTPSERVDWGALTPSESLAAEDPPATASARLQHDEQAAVFEGVAARAEAERAEDRLRAEAALLAAERAAERERAERLATAATAAAEAAGAEQARREAEAAAARRTAEQAAARAAAEARRREFAAARGPDRTVDPELARAAAAELAGARDAVLAAGTELVPQAVARERLADLLRPLATMDAAAYGDELVTTLEALVGLRWRLGDADGSREAAREAKALAAELGR